jgi:hypothetical protein
MEVFGTNQRMPRPDPLCIDVEQCDLDRAEHSIKERGVLLEALRWLSPARSKGRHTARAATFGRRMEWDVEKLEPGHRGLTAQSQRRAGFLGM